MEKRRTGYKTTPCEENITESRIEPTNCTHAPSRKAHFPKPMQESSFPFISQFPSTQNDTLQEINISHLGKRKIIFKLPFLGDMLVPWRVSSLAPPQKKMQNIYILAQKRILTFVSIHDLHNGQGTQEEKHHLPAHTGVSPPRRSPPPQFKKKSFQKTRF